ncbi:MAG: hypothetical protein A2Z83_02070 [Omnitrophica bacterium GWA2_52_8]|nr:MAG: hypothetical protein A2Z83_02070 [Omnitrophica bacterium GWA2_52_8]
MKKLILSLMVVVFLSPLFVFPVHAQTLLPAQEDEAGDAAADALYDDEYFDQDEFDDWDSDEELTGIAAEKPAGEAEAPEAGSGY